MKIIELQAENVKRLKAVTIRPNGNMVEIAGKNKQGKTSVLDAIFWAFGGGKVIQSTPIRAGEQEARIRLDLGTVKVTRTFKAKGAKEYTTKIIVENEDGARFQSPQALLDALLSTLTFDPLAFSRGKPKDQFETLKSLVPSIDFAEIEAAHKADYEARTDVNRKAKEASAAAASISYPEDTPDAPIDEAALISELEEAGAHNARIVTVQSNREGAAQKVKHLRGYAEARTAKAEEYRKLAAEQDAQALAYEEEAKALEARLSAAGPVPEPIDTTPIRQRIDAARTVNANVASRKAKELWFKERDALEDQSAALTTRINERQEAKRKAISDAKLPVEGLDFGEDEILLNGLPFDQASDAEQLRASIAIAMACNPKLKVIRVRDGSLLDDDAMTLLAEMAEANDCQVWIETVGSGHSNAIILEDGNIKEPKQPSLLDAAE